MTTAAMLAPAGADRTPPEGHTAGTHADQTVLGFKDRLDPFRPGVGTVVGHLMGAANTNICYFIGAWFFTGAGLVQVINSGGASVALITRPPDGAGRVAGRPTQSFGTLLFNVNTSAVAAHTRRRETPGAGRRTPVAR